MTTALRRRLTAGCAVMLVSGVAAFAFALAHGPAPRAWQAFLVNLLFWLGLAQGSVVVAASLYVTHARWGGATIYRLTEGFAGFLPVGFLLFWGLFPGREAIFPWIEHPLPAKAAWLNVPFLFARDGAGLLAITVLSLWFVRSSRRQESVRWAESSGDLAEPPPAVRRLAPAVILTYAGVYSLLAFDLVMSLSPVWYSTLFGAYFFAGAYWSALAAIGLLASIGLGTTSRGAIQDGGRALHDIGKLVFAFAIFWAYLLWSQYLPIWYAGLPHETFFVVVRVHALPWGILAWTALVLIWMVPFVGLISRRGKRTPAILGTVCGLGLIGMWIERYVLVTPSLSPDTIPFGWVECLVTAGFCGGFGLCALPGLRRVPAAGHGGRP
jgi:hypothetical protein